MGEGCWTARHRRAADPAFRERYFVGEGVDVGAGDDSLGRQAALFPRMGTVRAWDLGDGDGQYLASLADNSVDFVHSSHCLEHLLDPYVALYHWLRVIKPGGYVVAIFPDEDMYEQGVWPSTFNSDHKFSFTLWKRRSWSPKSVNVVDLVTSLGPQCEIIKLESIHLSHDWNAPRGDQTGGDSESVIEIVLRKRPDIEVTRGGRLRLV